MPDGSHNGDGPASVFLNGHLDLRVAYQSVCLEHICDRLLCLDLSQARHVEPRWNQGNADGTRLTDAHLTSQFRYIKHQDTQNVTAADGVLARGGFRRLGLAQRLDAFIRLFRSSNDGDILGM